MSLKNIKKTIFLLLTLTCIFVPLHIYASEYYLDGKKLTFKNELLLKDGITYVSLNDYTDIAGIEILEENKNSVTFEFPNVTLVCDKNYAFNKDGDSIATLYATPLLHNGIMYVPLRMPKEIDGNIIMYDTKTKNTYIYNYMSIKHYPQKFFLNDTEIKSDRFINLEKYLSLSLPHFDADLATIDKKDFNFGNGKIVYTAKDFIERKVTVFFNNKTLDEKFPVSDNGGNLYKIPDPEIETTENYVKATTNDFIITIYAKDTYEKIDDSSIYAEVKYIGNDEKAYFRGSSPSFTLNLKNDEYSFGGDRDDVSLPYTFTKNEIKKYEFKFYGNEPVQSGKYKISGNLELKEEKNGKPINISLSKEITLK